MIVTDKTRAVAATLPETLRATFLALVLDYRFQAFSRRIPQNAPLDVFATLVREGWSRPLSADEVKAATVALNPVQA